MTFDFAVYKLDWVNIPLSGQLLGYINNLPIFGTINGGRAKGHGVESQASARILRGLSANASFAYNRAERTFGAVVGTPRYTASGSLDYEFPLRASTAVFSVGANYSSRQSANIGSDIAPVYRYGDSILSARSSVAVKTQRGVDFSVFVENLTNEKGLVTPFPLPNRDLDMYPRPRTTGAQIDIHF